MTVIRILIMIVIIASTGVIRCNKINNDVHTKNSMLHNSLSHIHNNNDDGSYNTNTNTNTNNANANANTSTIK